jgi:hypothetical protein
MLPIVSVNPISSYAPRAQDEALAKFVREGGVGLLMEDLLQQLPDRIKTLTAVYRLADKRGRHASFPEEFKPALFDAYWEMSSSTRVAEWVTLFKYLYKTGRLDRIEYSTRTSDNMRLLVMVLEMELPRAGVKGPHKYRAGVDDFKAVGLCRASGPPIVLAAARVEAQRYLKYLHRTAGNDVPSDILTSIMDLTPAICDLRRMLC